MRLLSTSTITLHTFQGDKLPYYAILSHRWEQEEVSFQDLQSGKGKKLVGYAKIKGCCAQAASDGWKFVWIDTCCVDKTSSAELSEAINSMYRWYEDAQVCYAYLSDVFSFGMLSDSGFRRSKWFTRGWTLQELLAPSNVIFYDQGWNEIGTKSSLANSIKLTTGIKSLDSAKGACVAQIMYWASKRKTTRVGDQAYCLMGLLGVSIAPIYGEGENAFIRLQLEVLSKNDDESIFAWTSSSGLHNRRTALLASSPAAFVKSGNVEEFHFNPDRPPYSMTNKGLRMELPLTPCQFTADPGRQELYVTPLNCRFIEHETPISLMLERKYGNQFDKISDPNLSTIENLSIDRTGIDEIKVIYVRQINDSDTKEMSAMPPKIELSIRISSVLNLGIYISEKRLSMLECGEWWEISPDDIRLTLNLSRDKPNPRATVRFGNAFGLLIDTDRSDPIISLMSVIDYDKILYLDSNDDGREPWPRLADRQCLPMGDAKEKKLWMSLRKQAELGELLHVVEFGL